MRRLERGARDHPERCFIAAPRAVSYREALAAVRRTTGVLAAHGVRRGDRLLVVMPNRVEAVFLVLAALHLGSVFVLLHPTIGRRTLRWTVQHCRPALVVVDSVTAGLAAGVGSTPVLRLDEEAAGDLRRFDSGPPVSAAARVEDGELAALFYTSGSTGKPRGVMVGRGNIRFSVAAIQARLGYRPEDVVGIFLPFSFDYGLYQVFLALEVGATITIGDFRQAGPQLPGVLDRQAISVLPGTPRLTAGLLRMLADRPRPLPALRLVTNTGDRLPPALIRRLRDLLPHVRLALMYGLTECKRVSILTPEELDRGILSEGRPLDGTRVSVVRAAGLPLPAGQVGELRVAGPHVTLGYWRAGGETARHYLPAAEGHGQRELATGDLGSLDAAGYLRFAGRRDGLLKHHGFRVDPREIEEIVLEVPGVRDAAVIRSRRDDRLHLFVTPTSAEGPPPAVLPRLRFELESFKLPEAIHLLRELPTTVRGKVDRRRLAKLAEAVR